MQPTETSQADPAVGIAPPPRPAAPWRVVSVRPEGEQSLFVRFTDGTSGEVDLRILLASQQVAGTIFEPLREAAFFARATLEYGAVTWPNGADLAPDAMYDEIRAAGRWVVQA